MFSKKISNIQKKFILIISDVIIIISSISISYSLRLEKIYPFWDIDARVYLIFLIVFFCIFYFKNVYQILIRYFDYFSIIKIFKSVLISYIILIPINFLLYNYIYFPRSTSFIAPTIIGLLILFHRIFINFLINSNQQNSKSQNNVLVFGVNESNVNLIKSLRNNPNYGNVKGVIDLTGKYKKRELNGIKIFKIESLKKVIDENSITEIIIGHKSLNKIKINRLYNDLDKKNIRIRNLVQTKNYLNKFITQSFASKVDFFDIINRPKIKVEKKILKKRIYNKNILVTGGGGSIGSELCLEILKHHPKKLFILDISEINLFNLTKKINDKYKKKFKIILGDCNDKIYLKIFFNNIFIDDIYHAAAYKHVGLGEENPYSMIKNNVFGTKNLIEFALFKKIKNFIFISSDKAVNPKSILGVSKKFGEKLLHYYYLKNKNKITTTFTIIRFGNVIGSSGSVIPIFLDQIKNKTALTVTSKIAKRYFMSISEAVQLVINSSYFNKSGIKIYALDMGRQMKIYDIAKRIVKLSGHTVRDNRNPKGDIEIKIIGMKKGEKISEEITLGEYLFDTSHPKIKECKEKIITNNLSKDLKIISYCFKNLNSDKSILKKLEN